MDGPIDEKAEAVWNAAIDQRKEIADALRRRAKKLNDEGYCTAAEDELIHAADLIEKGELP